MASGFVTIDDNNKLPAVVMAELDDTYNNIRVDTTVGKRVYVTDTAGVEHRVFSDTGWRDITTSLLNGWTAQAALIRREGNHTTLRYVSLSNLNATSTDMIPMMQGFYRSPGGRFYETLTTDGSGGVATLVLAGNGGNMRLSKTPPANILTSGDTSWVCDFDLWPTVLPGTPA